MFMRKVASVLGTLVLTIVAVTGTAVASPAPSTLGAGATYTTVTDGGVLTYGWRPFTATEPLVSRRR